MTTTSYPTATPESIWAMIQETNKSLQKTEKNLQETSELQKENQKAIRELQKTLGGWANNLGQFAEEYFFNSFEKGERNFFGENFDRVQNKVKGINFDDEYDILLINGKAVGIIEVKFKAHENDIPKILGKADTFRANFPEYKNHKIFLGLATMSFYPELEQECINEGIAIIKQVGDNVVINDKHLKVF